MSALFHPYLCRERSGRHGDYYENILQAYEVDGDQYTLPANFWVSVLYLNKELCDAAGVSCSAWDTVDYTEILDIWRAAEGQGLLAEDFTLDRRVRSSSRTFLSTQLSR